MEPSIDMAKVRREDLRWLIILALNHARPIGCNDALVLSVARARYPDATALEVRRELDYLADRRLVEIKRDPAGPWHCELSRHGVDVAEYTVDVQPGIARPAKYWGG